MSILIIILLALAGFVALLLLLALLIRKDYFVDRQVIIHAPIQRVFDYIKHLKNQDNFNKWVMVDPEMKKEFRGTDGTVGFVYVWSGTKAGAGEQEIRSISEGKAIDMEIRFIKPFPAIARVKMTTEPAGNDQTKVSWSNASSIKYPMNLMISMIEKMLAKDMDTSLTKLKNILEK